MMAGYNKRDRHKRHRKDNWKPGVVIGRPPIMLITIAYIVLQKRKREREYLNKRLESLELDRELLPIKFSYQELASATNGFSSERILGQGGTGCVYKGYLRYPNHVVAVKRIHKNYNHAKEVFINELKIMCKLKCRNVVPLIGWSNDNGEFLLVYDYMPNGSLDKHLFGHGTHLQWKMRYNIVLGLGQALYYLHEASEKCTLHRDIKSANVLLDLNFNAKLGDFGAAMFLDPESSFDSTKIVGTFGYIAPEYLHQGRAGKRSDIYSFGVVALEVATGRRKHKDEESHVGLVEWVWELYVGGNVLDAADEKLTMDFNKQEMEHLLIVGLWCAHSVASTRPTISQAIQVLKFEAPLPNISNQMPVVKGNLAISDADDANILSITSSLDIGR